MAEFDYKQTPFRKTLTDAEYDLAVGRTPAPAPSRAECGGPNCFWNVLESQNQWREHYPPCQFATEPAPLHSNEKCKCGSEYVTIACSGCGADMDTPLDDDGYYDDGYYPELL